MILVDRFPSSRIAALLMAVFLLVCGCVFDCSAQEVTREEVWRCIKPTALYDSPGKGRRELAKIAKDEYVIVLEKDSEEYWRVETDGREGYAASAALKSASGILPDELRGWVPSEKESGDAPDCRKCEALYDRELDNYLLIRTGASDVVVKVMSKSAEVCVRYVYVRAFGEYTMQNLPQDHYYLKLAYGSDWQQKIVGGICVGKFKTDATYAVSRQVLDYHVKETATQKKIPSFSVTLRPITRDPERAFKTTGIPEDEFNR